MGNNEHEIGILIGELKAIRESIDGIKSSFSEFKSGVGLRVGKLENEMNGMTIVKDRVDWILKIGAWVIAPTIGALVIALLKVVLAK